LLTTYVIGNRPTFGATPFRGMPQHQKVVPVCRLSLATHCKLWLQHRI